MVSLPQREADRYFESCTLAGHTSNRYGVLNEETRDHPDSLIYRNLREARPDFWRDFQLFG